jgi:hypothetical protein
MVDALAMLPSGRDAADAAGRSPIGERPLGPRARPQSAAAAATAECRPPPRSFLERGEALLRGSPSARR